MRTQRPLARRTASSPLPGLGSSVSATGPQVRSVVLRLRDADRFSGAVLAHVGHERAVVPPQHGRLDVAEADQGLAGVPGVPPSSLRAMIEIENVSE